MTNKHVPVLIVGAGVGGFLLIETKGRVLEEISP